MAKIFCIKSGQLLHDDQDESVESYVAVLEEQLDSYFEEIKVVFLSLAEENPHYSFSEVVLLLPDRQHGDAVLIHNPSMNVARLREIVNQGFEKSKTV